MKYTDEGLIAIIMEKQHNLLKLINNSAKVVVAFINLEEALKPDAILLLRQIATGECDGEKLDDDDRKLTLDVLAEMLFPKETQKVADAIENCTKPEWDSGGPESPDYFSFAD